MRRSGPVQISGSGSTANEAHSIARARRVARQSLVFLSVYFWGSVVREMHVVERAWIQGRAHKQPRRDRMSAWSSDVMHAALGSRGCGHVLSTTAWGRVGSVPGGGGEGGSGGASRVKQNKCSFFFFWCLQQHQEKRAPVMPGGIVVWSRRAGGSVPDLQNRGFHCRREKTSPQKDSGLAG